MEDVVLYLVETISRHDPADLALFPEAEDVGRNPVMLIGPHFPCKAEACLDLVENKERLALIGNPAQIAKKFSAEVIVSALSLDRLDDDGSDVVGVEGECLLNFRQAFFFSGAHTSKLFVVDRKAQLWIADTGPIEFWKEVRFFRRRVGQRQRIAASAMEGLLEMKDLVAGGFRPPGRLVEPGLPVKCSLQGVLYGKRPTLDKKEIAKPVRKRVA